MTATDTLASGTALTLAEIRGYIEQSAEEVFATMLELPIRKAESSLAQAVPGKRVTALLGLTGEWSGSGQVSCDPELACAIASRFLMAEYSEVNDDVLDAVAELANMIVGNVKTALETRLGPMGLSTPVLISGDFETRVVGNPAWVTAAFDCDAGGMTVQLVLSKDSASPRRHRIGG